ncbi:hypothetical protein EUTSA_v10002866mg [Eutrema salsugineum]|uniref:Ubiquitin-like protease family profile domain-containing protein n=1 Tax=Eutrema salsugineum TaxID=72664 RepID=V4MXC0_EUTSA|nr:hypothetical protein EUTSA_v10002866mg [Eutrema salsugineum]
MERLERIIKGDHWIALDINLRKETIHVYDSIMSHSDDKEINIACRQFSRMLPQLLNIMVPENLRKKHNNQFKVTRKKGVPQNLNPGDCGVFSIKYIECLALGCTFDGICDKNVDRLRDRIASELFAELDEHEKERTDPFPHGKDKDHLITATQI